MLNNEEDEWINVTYKGNLVSRLGAFAKKTNNVNGISYKLAVLKPAIKQLIRPVEKPVTRPVEKNK